MLQLNINIPFYMRRRAAIGKQLQLLLHSIIIKYIQQYYTPIQQHSNDINAPQATNEFMIKLIYNIINTIKQAHVTSHGYMNNYAIDLSTTIDDTHDSKIEPIDLSFILSIEYIDILITLPYISTIIDDYIYELLLSCTFLNSTITLPQLYAIMEWTYNYIHRKNNCTIDHSSTSSSTVVDRYITWLCTILKHKSIVQLSEHELHEHTLSSIIIAHLISYYTRISTTTINELNIILSFFSPSTVLSSPSTSSITTAAYNSLLLQYSCINHYSNIQIDPLLSQYYESQYKLNIIQLSSSSSVSNITSTPNHNNKRKQEKIIPSTTKVGNKSTNHDQQQNNNQSQSAKKVNNKKQKQ